MLNIRVASVQFEHYPGDKEKNKQIIKDFAEKAFKNDVKILIFPECCITGYWFLRNLNREDLESIAEPMYNGPSSKFLMDLSKKFNMIIGAGLIEKTSDNKLYNSYVVAMPNGRFVKHRKLHAFINENVESGSEYTVFDTPFGFKAGILICYDNNINENVRITALKGADVLFAPHQTGGCRSNNKNTMGIIDKSLWENRNIDPIACEDEFRSNKGRGWLLRWLPSRAHDNGLFIIFSNGVGIDDDEVRTGNSMIIDPYGRIIRETWKASNDIVIADLDFSLIEQSTGRRWIKTRRPELYKDLTIPTGNEKNTRELRFDKKGI